MYREGEREATIRFGRYVARWWKENDKRGYLPFTPKGAHIWKTADAEIGKRIRRLVELAPPKSPVKVVVEGRVGGPTVGTASSLEMGVLEEATGSAFITT